MRITHSDPEFTGTEVVDTVAYEFVDGVAEVDDLRADRAAALGQLGWLVTDLSAKRAAAAMTEHAKGGFSKPREIGDDVPDSEMEQPEPEIGSA